MEVVRAECPDCGGTGLCRGICEGDDEAVLCTTCNGSGCKEIRYKPYKGRKRARGVKYIRVGVGKFIAGGDGHRTSMSYKEFINRFPEA